MNMQQSYSKIFSEYIEIFSFFLPVFIIAINLIARAVVLNRPSHPHPVVQHNILWPPHKAEIFFVYVYCLVKSHFSCIARIKAFFCFYTWIQKLNTFSFINSIFRFFLNKKCF